jgi:hypothetical protein
MALESTQPLVKMSTRNFPVGKGGQCVKLTNSALSHGECHEIWEPEPPATLWAARGLLWDSFLPLILSKFGFDRRTMSQNYSTKSVLSTGLLKNR